MDKIKGWKERGFNQDADYTPPLSTVPRPRILCVTYMIKKEHCTKGRAQLMTWGKRCDKLVHITDQHQPHLLPGTHVVTFSGTSMSRLPAVPRPCPGRVFANQLADRVPADALTCAGHIPSPARTSQLALVAGTWLSPGWLRSGRATTSAGPVPTPC